MKELGNLELIEIIVSGEEEKKERAYRQLIKQAPKFHKGCLNNCLCRIVVRANNLYRGRAWNLLMMENTLPVDFCQIIARCSDKEYQKLAWEMLLKMDLDDSYYFLYVIDYGSEPYRSMAVDEFFRRGYSKKDLSKEKDKKKLLEVTLESEFYKNKIAPLL